MARIGAKDFVGTRCRFQRLRDAKFFTGWIEGFFGNSLEVSCNTDWPVQIGDEFRFEGYGHHISVVFNARLDSVGTLDVGSNGVVTAIEGTSARILEAKRVSFKLTVSSQVRYAVSQESVRMKVNDLYTKVSKGPFSMEAVTVDVSMTGIGIVSKLELVPNEAVEVSVETPFGRVAAMGCVRYCRPDADRKGMFRSGIMFTDLGRVERPRWERFLKGLG